VSEPTEEKIQRIERALAVTIENCVRDLRLAQEDPTASTNRKEHLGAVTWGIDFGRVRVEAAISSLGPHDSPVVEAAGASDHLCFSMFLPAAIIGAEESLKICDQLVTRMAAWQDKLMPKTKEETRLLALSRELMRACHALSRGDAQEFVRALSESGRQADLRHINTRRPYLEDCFPRHLAMYLEGHARMGKLPAAAIQGVPKGFDPAEYWRAQIE